MQLRAGALVKVRELQGPARGNALRRLVLEQLRDAVDARRAEDLGDLAQRGENRITRWPAMELKIPGNQVAKSQQPCCRSEVALSIH